MITKCRNITTRINELENQINNISSICDYKEKTPLSLTDNLKNHVSKKKRPNTAPQEYSTTSLRVKVVHHMISRMQEKINKENIEKYNMNSQPRDITKDISNEIKAGKLPTSETKKQSEVCSSQIKNHSLTEESLKEKMNNLITSMISPEKDSYEPIQNTEEKIPILSIKEPPTTDTKSFCECMMNNPFNMNYEPVRAKNEVTVVGMVNNSPNAWLNQSFDTTPVKLEPAEIDDRKVIDNYLIDSLRGEIEKVRHKLCEIGNRPTDIRPSEKESLEKTDVEEIPSGDYNNQTLIQEVKELQKKNDDLSKQLEEHKKLQESSMKKAKDATHLLNAYEGKVNALHEQALKSSKMMAHSKEKFCNILRSRNCQIKNLYQINEQLKRTIEANGEQMKQLKNNYKILKARYKEIEERDKSARDENNKLQESMKKLEKELRIVYKECSKLQEENMKFLKELDLVKQDATDKYNMKLHKHKEYIEDLLAKSKRSETKLMEDVKDMSLKLHHHGNDLDDMKFEVKNGTLELQTKYKKLLHQYQILVKKFQEYEQFDEIKCSCIEQELKEFSTKMKEKESIILRERDELRTLVEELAHAIKQNKIAIYELSRTNDQHENVIDSLNDIIRSKDSQIQKYEKELEEVRAQYDKSEKEVENLKKILENSCQRGGYEQKNVLKELEAIRETLNHEKDNNLIKQKIIEDQEQTIDHLKGQIDDKTKEIEKTLLCLRKAADETNRLSENLRYMEEDLNREKQEKKKLARELEDINLHKESLTKQVSELEEAVKTRYVNSMDQVEHKHVIDKLHHQLKRQKQDWEIQRKILQKDKEKALHAARFASQKLLDTVNDFQKQMCQQKAAQNKLAMLLQGKEEQLEQLTKKVKCLLPQDNPCRLSAAKNYTHGQSVCASFCQIKQIYPTREGAVQESESVNESKLFGIDESNSCSTCCDYSDT